MVHRGDDNIVPIEDLDIDRDLNVKFPNTYLGTEMIQR